MSLLKPLTAGLGAVTLCVGVAAASFAAPPEGAKPLADEATATSDWKVTSGALSVLPGGQWWTDSPVFRVVSQDRFQYANVATTVKATINEFKTSAETPAVAWDGVHLFLRYKSQYSLYYATVARRDGEVVLKKKCEGGPSNGGTYYTLATGSAPVKPGQEFTATAAVTDTQGGVKLSLDVNGEHLEAVDTGTGCATITGPGRVGVRADNVDVTVTQFAVKPEGC